MHKGIGTGNQRWTKQDEPADTGMRIMMIEELDYDLSWLEMASEYLCTNREKRIYPDQKFYNEYDFICRERWNKRNKN